MKEHPNYPGYLITNTGEVYSCIKKDYRVKGRGSKTFIDYSNPVKLTPRLHPKNGYVYITLGGNGTKRLHRLVAETYIPNPDNLSEVNHIDRNKENNETTNLEWCNRQYNAAHSLAKHYTVKELKTGEEFEVFSLAQFCKERNLSVGSLWETLEEKRGRTQHKGYKIIAA
jgi:hypothetical protein